MILTCEKRSSKKVSKRKRGKTKTDKEYGGGKGDNVRHKISGWIEEEIS